MTKLKILCWNVNGIRAVAKKGFLKWLYKEKPDILCIQETKARPDQLPEELERPKGYYSYWNFAKVKAGYSGVALFTKEEPRSVKYGWGNPKFDNEGRIIIAEYPKFTLLNIYFPNGKASKERLRYKMQFYDYFLKNADKMRRRKKLVICGDFNTAHEEIDIARPKENEMFSGFLPMERKWMDKFESHGYIDTYRHFHPNKVEYSYWSARTNARARNVGWRIDYFYVTKNLIKSVKKAFILTKVMGSDHAPVGIILEV